jgi:hypothetical protein
MYALLFILLGAVLAAAGLILGGWAFLLLWPAVSLLLVGAAYAGLGPRILGKRPDGRLAPAAVVLLLPYLLATWIVWHIYRLVSPEPCYHEVAPGLWLGRRAFARELPPGVGLVIDMTAEFAAPRGVGVGREYHCLPTLDTAAPDETQLRAAVEKVVAWPGPVYVHCAQGHGRSALLAAAVLVRRNLATDARQAEEMLCRVRPGVRLTRSQRKMLDRLVGDE